jgi:hypothetical protein
VLITKHIIDPFSKVWFYNIIVIFFFINFLKNVFLSGKG